MPKHLDYQNYSFDLELPMTDEEVLCWTLVHSGIKRFDVYIGKKVTGITPYNAIPPMMTEVIKNQLYCWIEHLLEHFPNTVRIDNAGKVLDACVVRVGGIFICYVGASQPVLYKKIKAIKKQRDSE